VTELTVVGRAPLSLDQKIQFAKALAASNLLPRQYQGNPANLLFALEYAEALHVSPINAITSIHVIEGKPSASADLIAALVRRAGHKLRVTGDDRRAVAQIVRADDPGFTFEVEWTLDRARAAGLTNKGVWKQYPAAMLRSRAITEVARAAASDALFGVVYTPEELGAPADDYDPPPRPAVRPIDLSDAIVVDERDARIQLAVAAGVRPDAAALLVDEEEPTTPPSDSPALGAGLPEARDRAAVTEEPVHARPEANVQVEDPPMLPLEDWEQRVIDERFAARPAKPQEPVSPRMIREGQRATLQAEFRAHGYDRDARLAWITGFLEREVASANDLTELEADRVLDAIKAER